MKKEKKGQFYLIAAVIIVGIIISLSAITNYIVIRSEPSNFYDLSTELNEEGTRVVDYGIYNGEETQTKVEDFLNNYFVEYLKEKEKDTELAFVYGDATALKITTFTSEVTGEVSLNFGSGNVLVIPAASKYAGVTTTEENPGETVNVKILNNTYQFNLKKGENFFFVLSRNAEGEEHIARSPETDII